MVAAVGPEELRVSCDAGHQFRVDSLRAGDNFLEKALLLKSEAPHLVINNRIDRDGRLPKPIRHCCRRASSAAKFDASNAEVNRELAVLNHI